MSKTIRNGDVVKILSADKTFKVLQEVGLFENDERRKKISEIVGSRLGIVSIDEVIDGSDYFIFVPFGYVELMRFSLPFKCVGLSGADQAVEEREDQLMKHQRTPERDYFENTSDQLVKGAIALLHDNDDKDSGVVSEYAATERPCNWNEKTWGHMYAKPRKKRLAIAAALLIAEIDRMEYEEDYKKGGVNE